MKYINFTLQNNKFKEENPEKESDYNGYFKDPLTDEKVYILKVWNRTGKYGAFMSGSINIEKLEKIIEEYKNAEYGQNT